MVKKKQKKLTKEQKAKNKKRHDFSKQIREIFVSAGFESLNVKGFQFQLGGRSNELDHCYIFENIIILCEDTIKEVQQKEEAEEKKQPYNRNHKLEKNETAHIINSMKKDFYDLLCSKFPNSKYLSQYSHNRVKIFYLYFEYGLQKVQENDVQRYSNLKFIDNATLNYFSTMAKSIKASFRYELFRFLKLRRADIGPCDPFGNRNIRPLVSSIIYPESVTGYNNGVRMVSFMMKPIDLIENSYVLRKDGWEQDVDLYQRLITPKRIKSIRDFISKNKTTFLNNIIVTLPKGIYFNRVDDTGARTPVDLESITNYDNNIEINIPVDYYSMAIIDGQHRVYAYYQDNDENSDEEKNISELRNKLNLLVTGIIYPDNEDYKDLEKRKFESNLFVSINKNAKPVDADTLIQVQAIMNPTSGEAISRKVLERLNKEEPFTNMFQLSKVEKAPIKTASIIQYALSNLLVAKNYESSLYHYWLRTTEKESEYILNQQKDIDEYITYCTESLKTYFKAIKSKFKSNWKKDSKLLMIISLNAFIIAFKESLKMTDGPKNYDYYAQVFKDWDFSFSDSSEKKFPYAGAQYSRFAKEEIIPLFQKNTHNTL
ncbi:MAG TPA: DGQHR domain-containing protein [Candidatus Enterosoma merdigallinarum]|nr:DGQHR domain-containing protein [Candidatus Enterosoma merdigallinarum]